MNKDEQVILGFRNVYNKMVFLNKFKMEDSLRGVKSSEVHCIEYLGSHEDSNVTMLAESFFMTRGAISKITRKLIQKGVIESYQKADNKKEVYFRLTDQGERINKIHEDLHQEFRERDKCVFEQVSEEQFDAILSFVVMYERHLDAEIKKQGIRISEQEYLE